MNDFKQWQTDLDAQFKDTHYSSLTFFQRQFLAEQENRQDIFNFLIDAMSVKSKSEYCKLVSSFIERILFERSPCIVPAINKLDADKKAGMLYYPEWDFEKEDKWVKEMEGILNNAKRIYSTTAK